MCFLKLFNEEKSFKDLSGNCSIPIYSIFDKGERRNRHSNFNEYKITFDVSDEEWSNFPAQTEDAIRFLEKYYSELEDIILKYKVEDAYLDFPIYSRLSEEIVNQNDHLPKELITLAGRLGLGIEMAIYSETAIDDVCE